MMKLSTCTLVAVLIGSTPSIAQPLEHVLNSGFGFALASAFDGERLRREGYRENSPGHSWSRRVGAAERWVFFHEGVLVEIKEVREFRGRDARSSFQQCERHRQRVLAMVRRQLPGLRAFPISGGPLRSGVSLREDLDPEHSRRLNVECSGGRGVSETTAELLVQYLASPSERGTRDLS